MTYKELKEFINTIPEEYIDNYVVVSLEDRLPMEIQCGFYKENWYWDGDDSDSFIPESSMKHLGGDPYKYMELVCKKGEPYLEESEF